MNKLLIVEDQPLLRSNIVQILKIKGFQCFEACNGLEALKILETETPVLIISDVMMPEMDGFELLQRVRKHIQYNKIPFIILSALSDQSDKVKAIGLGADEYLTKPFSMQVLIATIEKLMIGINA